MASKKYKVNKDLVAKPIKKVYIGIKVLNRLLIFTLSISFLFTPKFAFANVVSVQTSTVGNSNMAKQSMEIKQVEVKSTPDPSPVIKTENSNFEAKGKITAISGDNFDIEGITVTKNPKYLVSISGNIEVGKNVTVKGVLENGLRYAKEIIMEGSNPIPSPSTSASPSNSTDTTNLGSSSPTPNNPSKPEVLSLTKTNRLPNISPSVKPFVNVAVNLVIGDQNIPLPKSSINPQSSPGQKSENNYLKPVIAFFENFFKGWF